MQQREKREAQAAKMEAKEAQNVASEISPTKPGAFPIVGIGASAGGIEALIPFFSSLPEKTGMAFAIVIHTDPARPSILPGLIQKYTRMEVVEAKDGMRIIPDHVYLTAPNQNMQLEGRTFRLSRKPERPYVAHSIDLFFRSLADELKDKAIGVILSGLGSDGTFGSRLINHKLGMVMVQDPATAGFPDMPRAVIESGVADYVLPPDKMSENLMHYAKYYFGLPAKEREKGLQQDPELLSRIFELFKERTKTDLAQFKLSTIYRRIQRRMGIRQIGSFEGYIRLLEKDPQEIESLYKEFVINVTRFFQDPEAYANLKHFFIRALKDKSDTASIRAWTLGCSTGEETYSFAILIQECLDELNMKAKFRVFATDLDKNAINLARTGLYPSSVVAEDVSPERTDKFFEKMDSYYQVRKEIRQNVVFAVLDFVAGPSFFNLDLISSRSILIYLNASAHRKIIPVMYSTLRPQGLVFLGARDSMERFARLFRPLDRDHKIYQRL